MLRRLALWLLDRLRNHLDPELQAEIDQYKEQAKQQAASLALVQRQVANLDAGYKAALDQRRQITESLNSLGLENEALDRLLEKVRDEEITLSDVPDRDVLRDEL